MLGKGMNMDMVHLGALAVGEVAEMSSHMVRQRSSSDLGEMPPQVSGFCAQACSVERATEYDGLMANFLNFMSVDSSCTNKQDTLFSRFPGGTLSHLAFFVLLASARIRVAAD